MFVVGACCNKFYSTVEKKASGGVRLLYKDYMFVCLLHGIHLSTDFREQI